MIDIHYEIDGKRVEPESIANAMKKKLLNGIAKEIKKELSSTYCEKHEEYPTIILEDNENINYSIETCCQELHNKANEKLGNL